LKLREEAEGTFREGRERVSSDVDGICWGRGRAGILEKDKKLTDMVWESVGVGRSEHGMPLVEGGRWGWRAVGRRVKSHGFARRPSKMRTRRRRSCSAGQNEALAVSTVVERYGWRSAALAGVDCVGQSMGGAAGLEQGEARREKVPWTSTGGICRRRRGGGGREARAGVLVGFVCGERG
jgi:hypothetical protein